MPSARARTSPVQLRGGENHLRAVCTRREIAPLRLKANALMHCGRRSACNAEASPGCPRVPPGVGRMGAPDGVRLPADQTGIAQTLKEKRVELMKPLAHRGVVAHCRELTFHVRLSQQICKSIAAIG